MKLLIIILLFGVIECSAQWNSPDHRYYYNQDVVAPAIILSSTFLIVNNINPSPYDPNFHLRRGQSIAIMVSGMALAILEPYIVHKIFHKRKP